MKSAACRLCTLLASVFVLASCTEQSTAPVSEFEDVQPTLSAVLSCDLIPAMTADVRTYFSQPERRTAQDIVRLLGNACGSDNAALVSQYSLELLGMIETAVGAGRGGDAAVGSRLANGLLACTTAAGCTSSALPGLSLAGALSAPAGLFTVRAGNAANPGLARATLAFTDFESRQNSALFGVELSPGFSWTQANGGSSIVLLYGAPMLSGGITLLETGFGGLQYSFNRWPDLGTFLDDDIVHVGVCFAQDIALPHDHATGKSTKPRMQREGTLLSNRAPTFCPPALNSASLAAPFAKLAMSLLPRGWFAMGDVRTPAIGGSAYDFSTFAPVAANVEGQLQMLVGPDSVVAPGASIGSIRIRARSGGGTPMERVLVTLYVAGNSGAPAGAVLRGTTSGYTGEDDGIVVIDGAFLDKKGGYRICARAELEGFTFTEACSDLFHIR